MRTNNYYESYYDDYQKIRVYMSKVSYAGKSSYFYVEDETAKLYECTIERIDENAEHYFVYTLSLAKPLPFAHEYEIVNEHARRTPLQYSGIVKTARFDEEFYYGNDDLGCVLEKNATHFSLWAPSAYRIKIEIDYNGVISTHEMQRKDKGVYRYSVDANIEGATYIYLIRMHNAWRQSCDPYAFASTENSRRSGVVDLKKLKFKNYPLPKMESSSDAIIYETSVRDFTMHDNCGVVKKGTFSGFTEENAFTKAHNTGFTYLKSLKITHVQLMPVFDFGSVDEVHSLQHYNWGYDPNHYRCLEGSYSSDPFNPLKRMEEFGQLVQKCHEARIRVNVDVVMNHVFDKYYNPLDISVPNYFFQMNVEGDFSNGSFCGNDFDTNSKMARKYVVDTCKKLQEIYHIDGIRFDLMGVMDIKTVNEIKAVTQNVNRDFMVYGEGWDMPSYLGSEHRASIQNQHKMPLVGHFSDRFRDVIKGKTSSEDAHLKGYISGDLSMIEACKNVMSGSCFEFGSSLLFDAPTHCVNYVECHDNMSAWDKLSLCCGEEDGTIRVRRALLMNACVILAQGIPFIHCGQEFARTKQQLSNTYNSGDAINSIDYARKDQFSYLVEQTKNLFEIRRKYRGFRFSSIAEMQGHVYFEDINDQVLIYRVQNGQEEIYVFINPSRTSFQYEFNTDVQLIFYNEMINPQQTASINIDEVSIIICIKS